LAAAAERRRIACVLQKQRNKYGLRQFNPPD
jgi:hypothetical protein